MIRVAAFTKYGREAASTRQRVLQYLPSLERAGIRVDCHPLLSNDYVRSLATGAGFSKREVVQSYWRRFEQLRRLREYDLIWIYAELFPWLPAGFERLGLKAAKPIIYDLDDAFFHPYDHHPNPAVRLLLRRKLEPLIGRAAAVLCGNPYLRDYAARLNPNSIVLPTVVDTEVYGSVAARGDVRPTIGWIGSPSTWEFVRPLLPLLGRICREKKARFTVVGAGPRAAADSFPAMERRAWSEAEEVRDVQSMDIGIMPLPDEPWARGKSGYKLVQYMACGLPVVASPVGVNATIVDHGRNGFLAEAPEQWERALADLIDDAALRRRLGSAGRQRAVAEYSLASQAPRLIDLMRQAAAIRTA